MVSTSGNECCLPSFLTCMLLPLNYYHEPVGPHAAGGLRQDMTVNDTHVCFVHIPTTTSMRSVAVSLKPSATPISLLTYDTPPVTSGTRPATTGIRQATSGMRQSTPSIRQGTSVARPATLGTRPVTSGIGLTISGIKQATSAILQATPSTRPAASVARPATLGTQPLTSDTRPATSVTRPATLGTRSVTSGIGLTISGIKQATSAILQATPSTRPAASVARPETLGTQPLTSDTRPATSVTRPATLGTRSVTSGIRRPAISVARPATPATRPVTSDMPPPTLGIRQTTTSTPGRRGVVFTGTSDIGQPPKASELPKVSAVKTAVSDVTWAVPLAVGLILVATVVGVVIYKHKGLSTSVAICKITDEFANDRHVLQDKLEEAIEKRSCFEPVADEYEKYIEQHPRLADVDENLIQNAKEEIKSLQLEDAESSNVEVTAASVTEELTTSLMLNDQLQKAESSNVENRETPGTGELAESLISTE